MGAFADLVGKEQAEGPAFFGEAVMLGSLAALVGVGAGFLAIGVRVLISLTTNVFFFGTWSTEFRAPTGEPWSTWVVFAPAAGALLAGLIVFALTRDPKIRGVTDVIQSVALEDARLSPRAVTGHALATTISVGSGGSAGREGAMVQLGSVLGFLGSRLFGFSLRQRKILIAAGAGAAVAATFNTPIAGVIFAIEVILLEFSTRAFVPLAIASVSGTVIVRQFLGNTPTFAVPGYELITGWELFLYVFLGLLAGVLSIVLLRSFTLSDALFSRLRAPWPVRLLIGGLLVGAVGYFVPSVFGVGYEVVEHVLSEGMVLSTLLVVLGAKILAVALTRGSGGASGAFSPSLFIGALLGEAFGQAAHLLFPGDAIAPPGAYALVGMAAVYGAVTRASLTAIVMLFEMTQKFEIILPLMLCVVIADVLAKAFGGATVYSLKIHKGGRRLEHDLGVNVLDTVTVGEIMTRDVDTVPEEATVREVVSLRMRTGHQGFPVVDKKGRLVGIITGTDLRLKVREGELDGPVSEYMTRNLITVTRDQTAHAALTALVTANLGHLPVVEQGDPRKLVGFLTRTDIVNVERRVIAAEQPEASALSEVPFIPPFLKGPNGPPP